MAYIHARRAAIIRIISPNVIGFVVTIIEKDVEINNNNTIDDIY